MNEKQRTMLQGMDMLMQKISKNLDSKTFTVLELIEMSNDVYSDIMENYGGEDESVGGYFDEIVCEEEEFGSDAAFDRYALDVMNGNGYYDEDGMYRSYATPDYD